MRTQLSTDAGRVHVVPVPGDPDFRTVEVRRGQQCRTIGRVARFGKRWGGLGIGARTWTPIVRTQKEAVAAVLYYYEAERAANERAAARTGLENLLLAASLTAA